MHTSKVLKYPTAIVAVGAVLANTFVQSLASDIKVLLNGTQLEFEVPPQIINDTTMVPMRKIFEELGYTVVWDNEMYSAYAYSESQNKAIIVPVGLKGVVVCRYDELLAMTDVDSFTMEHAVNTDAPTTIYNDTTLVPVRVISEASGYDVSWDGNME